MGTQLTERRIKGSRSKKARPGGGSSINSNNNNEYTPKRHRGGGGWSKVAYWRAKWLVSRSQALSVGYQLEKPLAGIQRGDGKMEEV